MIVLHGDDGSTISFVVKEHLGSEVLSAPKGLSYNDVKNTANWPERFKPEPITEPEGIQEGSIILIHNLLGGLSVYKVEENRKGGKTTARSCDMIAFLEFEKNGRNCWVCSGMANLASIQRLILEN